MIWLLLSCSLPDMEPAPPVAWQADCESVSCVGADYESDSDTAHLCEWTCADPGNGEPQFVTVEFRHDECGCWAATSTTIDFPSCGTW